MTKGLDKVFGLPSMEEILQETDIEEELGPEEMAVTETTAMIPSPESDLISHADLKAAEHSKSMDNIHDEVMQHARDAAELAFDLDPARAPRMLEVAAQYYKAAIDAKNSKRDAQLKLMKLLQDERKLALDEARLRHETGNFQSEKADVVMVEDRNVLLKKLRDEAQNQDDK